MHRIIIACIFTFAVCFVLFEQGLAASNGDRCLVNGEPGTGIDRGTCPELMVCLATGECRLGVDHKTWCCTKIQTDNVIPGEDFGSMNPIEIKEWNYRKCCSPQKSWGCCKNPCADYPCANGGTCIENNGIPICNCPTGFSGSHCGEKDLCATYKCSNGGTCVENNERPICNCPSGFSGSHCEKKDACTNYQCANGGVCVESNGTAKCNCQKGFSGEHCMEKE